MASTYRLRCCSHLQSSVSSVSDSKVCCANREAVGSLSTHRLSKVARYSGKIYKRNRAGYRNEVSTRCCGAYTLCSAGSFHGSGGAGRGGISGGGGNYNKPTDYSGGSNDDFSKRLWHNPAPTLLGAISLFTVLAAFPGQSHATPGSFFNSARNNSHNASSTSGKRLLLSSSAPANGSGGLTDLLERTSMESSSLGHSGSSSTYNSPSSSRSKAMHVSCKGSTLVVPLTGSNSEMDIPLPRTLLPWQRRKIVEAPIELSEREARMLASRQNRVRDSLLVQ